IPVLSKAVNAEVGGGAQLLHGGLRVSETGALRRRMETLSELEFLVETLPGVKTTKALDEKLHTAIAKEFKNGGLPLPVRFHFAETARFGAELARTTASEESWAKTAAESPSDSLTAKSRRGAES